MKTRQYLEEIVYTRQEIDAWLAGKAFQLEKYDGELGWLFRSQPAKDGIDGSICYYNFMEQGPRRMLLYADKPCRINTYGDSMTQCHQVNDAETWQEILAAHLQEPVRNYGIGGYSVYQAYRRMLREEPKTPAEYIIVNIFSDDHYRNLHPWRNIRSRYSLAKRQTGWWGCSPSMPYVTANPATRQFAEFPNPCPTPESVYNLCDVDWVYQRFKDDFVLKICVAQANLQGNTPQDSYEEISVLAREHDLAMKIDSAAALSTAIETLDTKSSLYASMCITEKVMDYGAAHGKKMLFVLSFGAGDFHRLQNRGQRFDQEFIDFLDRKGWPYVDTLAAHLAEFSQFKISLDEYLKRYYIGHYNPHGNHFTAFAMKDKLVAIMEPKPITYRIAEFPTDPRAAFDYALGNPARKSAVR